ncbi:hypothetical protein HPB50_012560 [Hyalomma asiaticum]|uniref:Uncharacterized protein n=1 Tax=Hyalomma asiaticum TaxID=266040 RepID=A0ACB7TH44_HYAAI|nr:hypothetical protein HPB50_012560 [Hyalomma asiaticum]
MTARSLQMAPLLQHTIKVVFRSQGGLFMPNIQPQLLLHCLCSAAKVLLGADVEIRVHPTNNTCTVATTSEDAALNLAKIRSITLNGKAYVIAAYIAPAADTVRGMISNAFWDETEEGLLQDLQARNPEASILLARHMGKSKYILITFAQGPVPRRIIYYGGVHLCTPYRARPEACTNCRAPGHRYDVCPEQKQPRCPRCGEDHGEDRSRQCVSRCILCGGEHLTETGWCKAKQRPKTTKPPAQRGTTGRGQLPQEDFPSWKPSVPPKVPEELTWAERVSRKPGPHDEEMARLREKQFLENRLQALEARFPTLEAQIDSLIDERFKIIDNKLDTFCAQLRPQLGVTVAEATNLMQAAPSPHTTHPLPTLNTAGQQNGRNMARPGRQVNEYLAPSGSELGACNTSCLAELEGVEARYTALSTWNKVLWSSRLELRHDVHKGLSLVSTSESFLSRTEPQVLRVTTLVHELFTTQRFLTALEIDTASFNGSEARFSEALRSNHFIRFLKVSISPSTLALHKYICAAIATLANLQEVECFTACKCPVDFCAALAKILRTSTKLTALRIPNLCMNGTTAIPFLPALLANSTLEQLSFHSSAIAEARPQHRDLFAKFLAGVRTMKKFTARSYSEVRPLSLMWVLIGLLLNTTVTEVALDGFAVDADTTDIMTYVLARNRTLRVLDVKAFLYDALVSRERGPTTSRRTDFGPSLFALLRNETLQAVTLPLGIWRPEQWENLFQSLQAKASPLKLTIEGDCSERFLWQMLWSALQRSGVEDQVSFDTTFYILDRHEMIECKAFSEFHWDPCQDHRRMSRLFRRLPSFAHVTTAHLSIWIPDVDDGQISDIARYISTKSALKELHLGIYLPETFAEWTKIGWAVILESLRQNASVNELRVIAVSMTAPQIELLADALYCKRNVRRLHTRMGMPELATAFVRRLCEGIEKNYSILSVTVDCLLLSRSSVYEEWFAIRDVTRRNSDFVARAALFVSGTVVDSYIHVARECQIYVPSSAVNVVNNFSGDRKLHRCLL